MDIVSCPDLGVSGLGMRLMYITHLEYRVGYVENYCHNAGDSSSEDSSDSSDSSTEDETSSSSSSSSSEEEQPPRFVFCDIIILSVPWHLV